MKKLILAASVSMLSFGASANCIYGHDAKIDLAAAELHQADKEGKYYGKSRVDPGLLALLKKQEAKKEIFSPLPTFN